MQVHCSTHRSVPTPDGELAYTMRLEQLPLFVDGARVGSMSAFSYLSEDEAGGRPVLFLTNGGPGSASDFLHLSGIGPKRAIVPDEVNTGVVGPYGVEDSPSTLLAVADLVFLDAPGTGFGRFNEESCAASFHGIEEDARAFAHAIAYWSRTHDRLNSPKFFLGESYGTHRAAMLAAAVHEIDSVPLEGILLLGQAINIQEVAERPGNVVGALANLPYKAAVAHYHGLGSLEFENVRDAVRAALDLAWADLAVAMLQGSRLPQEQLHSMAERVSAMIGIPSEELVASRLWISKGSFRSRLLRERGLTLGSNDSRYTAPVTDESFGEATIDATSTHLIPRYTLGLQQWLREAFEGEDPGASRVFDPNAARNWDWADSGTRRFRQMGKASPFDIYPYGAKLSRWMKQVPQSRLFIGTGIYDSLTTVGAADHLERQWDLPSDRVFQRWYEGGHMMYSAASVAAELNADLKAFVSGEVL